MVDRERTENTTELTWRDIVNSPDPVDERGERLCRWAEARAGVIVVAPLLGTVALMANEVYLVSRLANLYGKRVSEGAVAGFLAAFSGTIAGNLLATLIPVAAVQVPIAMSVTYGVGRAAQAWIKADMPTDVSPYVEMFQNLSEEAKVKVKDLKNDPIGKIPLGDEAAQYIQTTGALVKESIEKMKGNLNESIVVAKDNVGTAKETVTEKLSHTKENLNDLKANMVDNFSETKENVAHVASTAKVKVEEVARDKADQAAYRTADAVSTVATKVGEKAEQKKEEIAERMAERHSEN